MLYGNAKVVSKSDTVAEPEGVCDGLLVAAAGNISMVTPAGNVITITGAPVGTVIPIQTIRVNSTGTTATVVGLFQPKGT